MARRFIFAGNCEGEIIYWHCIADGFAGRRNINEL
jgi:hypothetical protein